MLVLELFVVVEHRLTVNVMVAGSISIRGKDFVYICLFSSFILHPAQQDGVKLFISEVG